MPGSAGGDDCAAAQGVAGGGISMGYKRIYRVVILCYHGIEWGYIYIYNNYIYI